MEKFFCFTHYYINLMVRLSIIHFLNFLFHILTIKQVIESISGCWNTSSGQSGSDVIRCTDSTEKMSKMLILC